VLIKIKYKLENREGNSEGARDIDEINLEISDLDLEEVERKRR